MFAQDWKPLLWFMRGSCLGVARRRPDICRTSRWLWTHCTITRSKGWLMSGRSHPIFATTLAVGFPRCSRHSGWMLHVISCSLTDFSNLVTFEISNPCLSPRTDMEFGTSIHVPGWRLLVSFVLLFIILTFQELLYCFKRRNDLNLQIYWVSWWPGALGCGPFGCTLLLKSATVY